MLLFFTCLIKEINPMVKIAIIGSKINISTVKINPRILKLFFFDNFMKQNIMETKRKAKNPCDKI
jgi:hypothetical protein